MLILNLSLIFFITTVNSISCIDEVFVRHEFGTIFSPTKSGYRLAPSFIRMVFHDAIDFENLRSKESSDLLTTNEGGVDFCYNNPIKVDGTDVNGAHNRNLPVRTVNFVKNTVVKKFGEEESSISEADISVIGAIVALEETSGGPQVPIKLGRKTGDCEQTINCSIGNNCAENKFLRTSLEATSFDSNHFHNVWETLGFTVQEQTALMGAHSFGKLQVCAGGFGGIEKGPFSGNVEKITPEINMVNNIDLVDADFEVNWNCSDKSDSCSPRWPKNNGEYGTGFGDGGFFDQTPTLFDNDYFNQLVEADDYYKNKDFNMNKVCCGKIKNGVCHRRGTFKNFETKENVDKNELLYCRSDRKGRSHLKSLTKYVVAPKNFVKKADHHGYVKRVIMLGGDASLLDREDTKMNVEKYADDQTLFFDDFSEAYEKVTNLSNDVLSTCSSADCSYDTETSSFRCGELTFPTDNFDCDFNGSSEENCELIGGLGARGIIQCQNDDDLKLCCVNNACTDTLDSFDNIHLD